MKKTIMLALAVVASASFCTVDAQKKKKVAEEPVVAPVELKSSSDSVSYAAGMSITNGLMPYLKQQHGIDSAQMNIFIKAFEEVIKAGEAPEAKARVAGVEIASQVRGRMLPGISGEFTDTPDSIEADLFYRGFTDALKQDTTVFKMAKARDRFESKTTQARETRNRIYKKENEEWLANNKTKPGVITLPSGLQYKVLKEGNGPKPKATDEVEVIYEGKTINGKVFDATKNHGGRKTDSFRCDQVIKGWTEALTSMNVGSKWEIYIPQELAYGSREAGEIKPYSTLIFTVELVGIKTPETKPAADAKTTTDSKSTSVKAKTTTKSASKSNKKSTKKK